VGFIFRHHIGFHHPGDLLRRDVPASSGSPGSLDARDDETRSDKADAKGQCANQRFCGGECELVSGNHFMLLIVGVLLAPETISAKPERGYIRLSCRHRATTRRLCYSKVIARQYTGLTGGVVWYFRKFVGQMLVYSPVVK
jgi:hypothetical protein